MRTRVQIPGVMFMGVLGGCGTLPVIPELERWKTQTGRKLCSTRDLASMIRWRVISVSDSHVHAHSDMLLHTCMYALVHAYPYTCKIRCKEGIITVVHETHCNTNFLRHSSVFGQLSNPKCIGIQIQLDVRTDSSLLGFQSFPKFVSWNPTGRKYVHLL